MFKALYLVFLFLIIVSAVIFYNRRIESFSNNDLQLKYINPDYSLSEYYPLGIKVVNLKRRENFKNTTITKEELLKKYDYDTLIYNIFLSYDNSELVIIGPPLFNFYEKCFPLHFDGFGKNIKIQKNSDTCKFTETQFFFKITIPIDINNVKKHNDIKMIFKNKQNIPFKIPKNNYKCGDRILVTKQKDNKIQWISDWISHYQTKYKVSNIIVFDNNSKNTLELSNKLADNSVKIIPYKYNFGVPKTHQTSFFQNTILEIAKLQFCKTGVILFNFDIDELLQIIPHKLNTLFLNNNKKINLTFREWRVPMTINNKSKYNYSFGDFKYKKREASKKGYAPKYIVTIDKKTSLGIHNANNGIPTSFLDDCFFHYSGINTNWKHNRSNLENPESTKDLIRI